MFTKFSPFLFTPFYNLSPFLSSINVGFALWYNFLLARLIVLALFPPRNIEEIKNPAT